MKKPRWSGGPYQDRQSEPRTSVSSAGSDRVRVPGAEGFWVTEKRGNIRAWKWCSGVSDSGLWLLNSGQSLLPGEGIRDGPRAEESLQAHSVLARPPCLRNSFSCLPHQLPTVVPDILGSKECEGGAGLALNEGDRCEWTPLLCPPC